jgi:glycosyltransferase involved in cell wall biosynthesis
LTQPSPFVLLNGIDHQIFRPQPEVKKSNELLFVGRPDVTKGYPTFVAVLEKLQGDFPTLRGRVAAPARYTVTHPLITHAAYTQEELASVYAQSQAYLNVSMAESFGFPPLEAMACECPVVLTSTTGTKQYVRDGENCLVVPQRDIEATATAVTRLLKDKELTHRLIKNGKATAAQFNWEAARASFSAFLADLDQNR